MGVTNKPGLSNTHGHTIVRSLELTAVSKTMPLKKVPGGFSSLAPGCCPSTLLQSEREKCVASKILVEIFSRTVENLRN